MKPRPRRARPISLVSRPSWSLRVYLPIGTRCKPISHQGAHRPPIQGRVASPRRSSEHPFEGPELELSGRLQSRPKQGMLVTLAFARCWFQHKWTCVTAIVAGVALAWCIGIAAHDGVPGRFIGRAAASVRTGAVGGTGDVPAAVQFADTRGC